MPPTVEKPKARERLTRDRVVLAALRIMDSEGIDAVTMRRVAREVGVEAMSLYHHVHDKDDLLDAICEAVMRDFRVPEAGGDWLQAGRACAMEWRRVLRAHPQVIPLLAERHKPMRSVEALQPMEFTLGCLLQAGLSPRDAGQAFHTIGGYIMGFVVMETGLMFGAPEDSEQLQHAVPGGCPNIAAVMPIACLVGADEQFAFGLDLMLLGLMSRLSSAVSSVSD
jgi:AcrR family transcriptional regulator